MSYLTITDFIDAGRKSLKEKNYWSALSVALMLPGMCSRIYFANEPDKYRNFKWNDRKDHKKGKEYTDWKDKECYVDFCNQIMHKSTMTNGHLIDNCPDLYLVSILGFKYGEILYDLRCGIIHAGEITTSVDDKKIYLMLGEYSTATDFTESRTIPIIDLCEIIFGYIEGWYEGFKVQDVNTQNLKYTRIFDMENSNDKSCYKKCCNDERADA